MIDALFSGFSFLALCGWVSLAAAPGWTFGRRVLVGGSIPIVLSVAYLLLFPALYFNAPGGFGSIDAVLDLLTSDRRIVLAAWLHYLAFDLLIGLSMVEEARRKAIPHALILAPLALCLMFGPVGWLAFQALKAARGRIRVRP